ncbi:4-hydroxy-tetrahydrodipicolinate synthase [Zhouia amylolytica]|uniref:Dihydrodipicolinate synthetase n=2 Tax=Zhouia amylolytica TaxID=376730 RepID=W2UQV1_9FLAO|nr:dihydrodipicolinate synthase family protein [Zhouia amylolytica]ETN96314.1 dihydrodipicolinate synthetase [Zhouia amylolytica AD3]MCQ0112196.1 dihydrodipicolinate synthase family protein [Zhouia amylolytica]SFS87292.1 4-hydroxy-tetrahydrodipicolinate synthase [Zhouia amylolytica]
MRTVKWNGVYPAVTTKFKENGDLDIPAFLKNIEHQIDAGVNGIIIGGSLGESSTLTHDDRLALLEATVAAFGDQTDVLLNVAEGATTAAIELVQRAEKAGAHGFMLLPPMMYKPTDQEVADYFKTVARSTKLPILLYNNPVDYKIEITLPIFEQLASEANIQAVKESTRDISNVTRMKNKFGDRFKILCGVDTLAMEELLMGADGWVAGLVCAFPKETVAIYELVKAGKIDEALEIYRWFLPILELDINPQLVQNIKLAEVMTGIGTEPVRAPRHILVGDERKRVIKILEDGIASRPILPDYKNL